MSEDLIEQHMGRCQHFTGLFGAGMVKHETCAAGVRYDVVRVDHEPMPYESRGITYTCSRSFPCLSGPAHNPGGATCDKRVLPTLEEAQAHVERSNAGFKRVMAARKAITNKHGKERGVGGTIDCPNCDGGKLSYSIAGSNGHIHGRCTTEDCCSWME